MSKVIKKILSIASSANGSDNIEVWTNTFKVVGTLITDQSVIVDDIVTIKNAKICKHFGECECGKDQTECSNWLNILDDQIIAFSILPK